MSASVLTATAAPSAARRLSWGQLVALHLLPGALITATFAGLALALAPAPANLALLLAVLLVTIPVELGYVIYRARRATGRAVPSSVPALRTSLFRRGTLALVAPLTIWSVLAYTLLAPLAERLREVAFAWWPAALALGGLQHPEQLDRGLLWLIVGLSVPLNIAGPLVEELYFRGHLLPRMARLGPWAPLVNVTLFSLYHLWLPWEFLSRLVALVPAVYVVWWKRDLAVSVWVHVLLNSVGSVGLAALVVFR